MPTPPAAPLLARFPRLPDFLKLARFDRPIGIWLLLWPTLWAVYIAGNGNPPLRILLVFGAGVVLMRAAGCVINDIADRKVDGQVARTKERPLATGRIQTREAAAFFILLLALAASLLLFLNKATFYWALGAVAIASLYPFMKRYTYLPQVVLGAAFSWGIPMAFVAQGKAPGPECWLIFAGNLCWTVAYDTYYAMADREDDLKAGIKSTAILFGDMDLLMIGMLQAIFLFALWLLGGARPRLSRRPGRGAGGRRRTGRTRRLADRHSCAGRRRARGGCRRRRRLRCSLPAGRRSSRPDTRDGSPRRCRAQIGWRRCRLSRFSGRTPTA